MEDMTLHNLKKQVKEIDEKVAKLLTPEAQTIFQTAYEKALRDSPTSLKGDKKFGFSDTGSNKDDVESQKSDKSQVKTFDDEELAQLYKKIEPLAPYERLNFIRSEFDLGRNPNSQKG